MVFSTYIFIFWFLPLTLLVYYCLPFRWKSAWLLVTSYVFYGWWKPEYCALLLGVTALNYWGARRIARAASHGQKRFWVGLCVISSLGILGFWKYAGMLSGWLDSAIQLFVSPAQGAESVIPILDIVLPIGISFYTFQAMSYSIDIYRGEAREASDFVSFAAYIAMFPQLIAGPIVRYHWIADELRSRSHTTAKFFVGTRFLAIGLAKKVLLADLFALAVPAAFGPHQPDAIGAWVGTLAYSLQIYFDFSAYSDMAVGLGLMLGFTFPPNFDSPYKSASITEFWRRWHISLSSWLRDYLYLPLGGNRHGRNRTYVNLMIVMVLGGLWHGASALFLIWGLWHGVLLALERALGDRHPIRRLPRGAAVLVTNLLVLLGWVVFRAADTGSAVRIFEAMFLMADGSASTIAAPAIAPVLPWLLIPGYGICLFLRNTWEMSYEPRPLDILWTTILLAVSILVVLAAESSPFLYFQF